MERLKPSLMVEAVRRWRNTSRISSRSSRSGMTGRFGQVCGRNAQTSDSGQPHVPVSVSGAARHHFVKKVLHASEQERADVARARRRWMRKQGLLDLTHLVFIDETSVNTNMTRSYGRGPRGDRVIGRVPFAAWKTLTFVAALRCDRMTAPMMIKGALDGEVFLAYVEQCLLAEPSSAATSSSWTTSRLTRSKGCKKPSKPPAQGCFTCRHIPRTSTRFENAYGAFKAFLRKCAERTEDALHRRAGQLVRRLRAETCANFFAHAGYAI